MEPGAAATGPSQKLEFTDNRAGRCRSRFQSGRSRLHPSVDVLLFARGSKKHIGQKNMDYTLADAQLILARTPKTLDLLLRDLPDDWTNSNEGAETWSPFDVIGHLIHGDETDWMQRAKHIVEFGESRAFTPFDRFAMFRHSQGKSINQLLDEFQLLRSESLEQLDQLNITDELLEKRGTHPELGVVSLRQLLSTWVVHDLSHIGQVVRVMSKQYKEAVGPWQEYLPSLTR